jgi:alanine dehydrogenase
MPGDVGRTSSQALCNATLPFIRKLASLGADAFAALNPGHAAAINIKDHKIANNIISEVFPDLPK